MRVKEIRLRKLKNIKRHKRKKEIQEEPSASAGKKEFSSRPLLL